MNVRAHRTLTVLAVVAGCAAVALPISIYLSSPTSYVVSGISGIVIGASGVAYAVRKGLLPEPDEATTVDLKARLRIMAAILLLMTGMGLVFVLAVQLSRCWA